MWPTTRAFFKSKLFAKSPPGGRDSTKIEGWEFSG